MPWALNLEIAMGKTWIVVAVVAAGACGWFGQRAFSDDPPAAPAWPPEMEKLMTELATPGEHHKWLAAQEGTWDIAMKTASRDGKMKESKGTATFKMILGGRFQEQRIVGVVEGKPMEGFGITGYDNNKKEFVNYWFDTMGTSPSVARGQRTEDGKAMALDGTWDMPGMTMKFKMLTTVKSDKEMAFVMTGTMGDQSMPMMEATYTKR